MAYLLSGRQRKEPKLEPRQGLSKTENRATAYLVTSETHNVVVLCLRVETIRHDTANTSFSSESRIIIEASLTCLVFPFKVFTTGCCFDTNVIVSALVISILGLVSSCSQITITAFVFGRRKIVSMLNVITL